MIFLNGMVKGDLIARDSKESREVVCITLWLPWAMWVAWGWKTIETRTHQRFKSLVGQCIGIHASLTWDKNAIEVARPYLTREQIQRTYELFSEADKYAGCFVAAAQPLSHRPLTEADERASLIECKTRRWGLDFGNGVKEVSKPYPVAGHQGIWKTLLRFEQGGGL